MENNSKWETKIKHDSGIYLHFKILEQNFLNSQNTFVQSQLPHDFAFSYIKSISLQYPVPVCRASPEECTYKMNQIILIHNYYYQYYFLYCFFLLVIAVGYKSGVIRICDVEKGDLVYVGLVKGGVTYLEWMQQSKHMCEGPDLYVEDNTSKYLPTAQQVHSL